MKHYSTPLIILILLSCFLFYSCPQTTTPEPPKPRASVKVEVASWPLDVFMIGWPDYIALSFTVIVTESNGVSGTISKVQAQVFLNDVFKAQDTLVGGRFSAFGSWSGAMYIDKIWTPDYKVDKIIITVEGGDDNGYAFSETFTSALTW